MATAWYPLRSGEDGAADTPAPHVIPPPALPKATEPPHQPHPVWGSKRYLVSNNWGKVRKEDREAVRRSHIHGVEVRDLPVGHLLYGEQGLFATRKFEPFDIVGEYTGLVVGHSCYGHYVAALDHDSDTSLGIDAQECGNELRFINSHLNVAFSANVTLRVAYVRGMPHVLVVCRAAVEPGEELLLDYGAAYNTAYLLPPADPQAHAMLKCTTSVQSQEQAWASLPGGGDDSDEEDDKGGKRVAEGEEQTDNRIAEGN